MRSYFFEMLGVRGHTNLSMSSSISYNFLEKSTLNVATLELVIRVEVRTEVIQAKHIARVLHSIPRKRDLSWPGLLFTM